MRGKKISIALTIRSLDPRLRGLVCWVMVGIGLFITVYLKNIIRNIIQRKWYKPVSRQLVVGVTLYQSVFFHPVDGLIERSNCLLDIFVSVSRRCHTVTGEINSIK